MDILFILHQYMDKYYKYTSKYIMDILYNEYMDIYIYIILCYMNIMLYVSNGYDIYIRLYTYTQCMECLECMECMRCM